jgi:hypothetical protein
MSYSVDPPQLLSVAERLRSCFDDLDELVASVRRAADAVSHSLARAASVRAAFTGVADPRVDLARRLLGRGRSAIAALQSAALAYLTADDEMATTTASSAANADSADGANPYDPAIFGKRRL